MAKKSKRLEFAARLGATFDYQQEIIECQDRFRTIKKPRQAGMTTALGIEALIDALTYNDYVIGIISPTSRQSIRMMRYIKKALRKLEKQQGQLIPTEKFTNEEVIFPNGSEIHSLPNNPLGVQGFDLNHGIIDEAGLFTTTEGEAIIDALVGSLAAKQGRLTISGRPRGKRGLLWQYWDPSYSRYKEFTHFAINWRDRARQDKSYGEEVERHERILTKLQFDEIYNAEFVDEGVLIYPHELLEASIKLFQNRKFILMNSEGTPQENLARYIGIDFGRVRNLTEIHVLQKESDTLIRSLMMKSMFDTNFEVQKAFIDDLIKRVKPSGVVIDERGMGLPLLDYLQARHGKLLIKPLKLTNLSTKEKAVLQLRNALADLKLAISDDEKLYEQMHAYQKEYTDQGNVRYFGKVDETDFLDDKVVALMAAIDAAQSMQFDFKVC